MTGTELTETEVLERVGASPLLDITREEVEEAPTLQALEEEYGENIAPYLTNLARCWNTYRRVYVEELDEADLAYTVEALAEAGVIRLYEREGKPCVKIGRAGLCALLNPVVAPTIIANAVAEA